MTKTQTTIQNCGACGKPVTEGQHPGCYTINQPSDTPDLDLIIRIDNSADWAEVEQDGIVTRRCHADSELIDTLTDILKSLGATIEWTTVTGPRV
jgi:hypothetical protein